MTDTANGDPPDLARFLRDWAALWGEAVQDWASDPAAAEVNRMTAALWGKLLAASSAGMGLPGMSPRMSPLGTAASGERRAAASHAPSGTPAAAAAPDARDAAVERLSRRIDTLEARLAALESPGATPDEPPGTPCGTAPRGRVVRRAVRRAGG